MLVRLGGGRRTTVHVAEYPTDQFEMRVARLPAATGLLTWCRANHVEEALVGGFYVRDPQRPAGPGEGGMPLGLLRIAGDASPSVAFDSPWGERRACVTSLDGEVRIVRPDRLSSGSRGDLLQAGPILVRDGEPAAYADEGFSEGSGQFDSDITAGRHPRAALGVGEDRLIAVATEGRTSSEAGLTIDELARTMIELGARSALNLDGGGSTTMVRGGRLRNVPREGDGTVIAGGRPIATALAFIRR